VLATVPAGDLPSALCYNSQNNKVYCANAWSSNVTVIDGATNVVVATVPTDSGPYALCYNSIDNKVYCANVLADNLTVIGGSTDSVVATVPVGDYPMELLHNPGNNKIYCSNYVDDSVAVVAGASDTVILSIGVGSGQWYGPYSLTLNPAQNRVYVANEYGSCISVIRDSAAAVEEARQPLLDSPHASATVVSGALLQVGSRQHSAYRAGLLDAAGRKVMELRSGPNDVRALAPGVYFVSSGPSLIRKAIVTR
jgi:YVTN family beta-propeller protein